jgi:Flp pilus assembly protein TadG
LVTGRILRSYLRSTSANMAIMTAIALPALLGVLGLASDYAQFSSKRTELQGAADKAALAAAKELSLATSSRCDDRGRSQGIRVGGDEE